jgi:hypothetical protein
MPAYQTETKEVSAQLINSNFVRKLEAGRVKEAQDEGSAFIRTKVRQESFFRELINPITLQDDELDRDEDTDQPKKIVEKEPESVATFVPFTGTGPQTWFKGPRYAIKFGKTVSQVFSKSKFELMTYQNDLRSILSKNMVLDMADQEDVKGIATVDAIIALNAAVQLTAGSAFNSSSFRKALQALVHRRQPIGKLLMTKELLYEAVDLPATSVGDAVASRHYDEGVEEEEKLWGIPVVSTMKSDILNPKKAYVFAPENFLGNFFLLQDATLYIEQKMDIITFCAYAAPGFGFGNTLAMQAIAFPGA